MLSRRSKPEHYEEFNSYLDQNFGEIKIFDLSFPASRVLEELDVDTYDEQYGKFTESRGL